MFLCGIPEKLLPHSNHGRHLRTYRECSVLPCLGQVQIVFVSFREDPGQGHWYPNVLNNSEVQDFIHVLTNSSRTSTPSKSFTLTVTAPQECGTLHGWRINQLNIPGRWIWQTWNRNEKVLRRRPPIRFGRLQVTWINDSKVTVEPSNILSFIVPRSNGPLELSVENSILSFMSVDSPTEIRQLESDSGKWEVRTIIQPILSK